MKTVLRIFGILVILISLITCAMSIYRANLDKKDLAENQTELAATKEKLASLKELVTTMTGESKKEMDGQIATLETDLDNIPSSSTYVLLQVLLSVLLLLALTYGVLLFKPNLTLTNKLFWATVFLVIITFLVSPDLKRGEYGGLPSRTLALLSGIPVLIAGLFALLVAKRSALKN